MKNIIYVYNGPNIARSVSHMLMENFYHAFARHGLLVKPISPEIILNGRWIDNAYALIWGGGETTEFRRALSRHNEFIKQPLIDAHNNGTHFVGYCGGAYLGMEYTVFEGIDGYKREGEGLGLLKQRSPGPVIGLTPSPYSSYSDSASIIRLKHEDTGKEFASLYCCGPYFPIDTLPAHTKPLAVTTHPITGQEYILGAQLPAMNGRGSVTLYGYHPDFTPEFIIRRNLEAPSIPLHDERLRRETSEMSYNIILGYNLMLRDLKTAMKLEFEGKKLVLPPSMDSLAFTK